MESEFEKNVGKMTFEEAAKRLSEIVTLLERGEAPLDEMLKLYEEGTALIRRANSLLDEAEKRVNVIEISE